MCNFYYPYVLQRTTRYKCCMGCGTCWFRSTRTQTPRRARARRDLGCKFWRLDNHGFAKNENPFPENLIFLKQSIPTARFGRPVLSSPSDRLERLPSVLLHYWTNITVEFRLVSEHRKNMKNTIRNPVGFSWPNLVVMNPKKVNPVWNYILLYVFIQVLC